MSGVTIDLRDQPDRAPHAGRRTGYVVAALVNLVMLWVVGQLLGWGWPSFLTEDFEQLLPVITFSLGATVVLNLLWAIHDPAWFRHLGQIALNLISLAVVIRTWQVFPFDFSGVANLWEPVVRWVLALSALGLVIATIVEFVRLGRILGRTRRRPPRVRQRSTGGRTESMGRVDDGEPGPLVPLHRALPGHGGGGGRPRR